MNYERYKGKKFGALELDDIISLYITSEDKDNEIFILAELTESDSETIIEVLKDLKIYKQINIRQCSYCKKLFIDNGNKRLRAVCKACKIRNRAEYKGGII